MPPAVPRQKRDAFPFQHSHYERVGRLAKRSAYLHFGLLFEAGHRIKSAASDNSNLSRAFVLQANTALFIDG